MNQPLVSIIIPTYNRAHLIGETLDSVLAQTYQNWECIIMDDGSTDNTDEVVGVYVKQDSRFQYHHRPKDLPKGANACRNYGFELSKGEYINWFDDDDIMLVYFISSRINEFSKNNQFIIGSGFYWDPIKDYKKKIDLELNTNLYQDYLFWNIHILTPSILFRKNFLLGKKLFSSKIERGQETELYTRLFYNLSEANYKIINLPLFLYREHSESKTKKNEQYVKAYAVSKYSILVDNFIRNQNDNQNNNKVVINFLYQNLIDLYFKGLENNDIVISKRVVNNFFPLLLKTNFLRGLEIFLLANVMVVFNRESYFLKRRWAGFKF